MFIFVVLVIIFNIHGIFTEKYAKLYNIVCEISTNWAENTTCGLKVIGREPVVANLDTFVKMPLSQLTVHLKLYKFFNQFRPFLVDVKVNICDVINKKSTLNFYGNTLIRIWSKYTNAVKCPITVIFILIY